ncbi:hypothetical protein B7463_g11737, partial [Scytalidium lignicola]
MLLVSQGGSVKIGEVVRYTVTYTPAHDRILPSPAHLHLKIKNTSTIALRAAFIHGPYTLYVAAYPSTFDPNKKFENPKRDGVPEFEPQLKAGGSFTAKLAVPEEVRKTAGSSRYSWGPPGGGLDEEGDGVKSVSWIIEVASQVIFSASAAVHYEIYIGRDEKSLSLGSGGSILGGGAASAPVLGQVSDHQQSLGDKDVHHHHHHLQPKGVYSRSIRLKVEDTGGLWDTPKFPEWDGEQEDVIVPENMDTYVQSASGSTDNGGKKGNGGIHKQKRQKKVHLVVLTHGLHSNLGADMLYMKESIDIAARQAKLDAKARREKRRREAQKVSTDAKGEHDRDSHGEETSTFEQRRQEMEDDDDHEEVIVRGFSGNATRTEKGIKYLGKRLARYVLNVTYPDQPYRPILKSTSNAFSHAIKPTVQTSENIGSASHNNSTIHEDEYSGRRLAYRITSISFIAHSLGGLIQTYAVAYIQKHSPEFFDLIKPINFIALATPFLGLSNENPLYVKFALDFGLVGRTGQDLGLTWRAPTLARSGWGAIVNGISENTHKKEGSPEAKPLLRILPTGPAHVALKKFRNRTVYSNVVNDGIVPLRTSCLLFLDWQGLDRVEKARRENGLIGTVAEWGWGEITGASSSPLRKLALLEDNVSDADDQDLGSNTPTREGHGGDVPQPDPQAARDDEVSSLRRLTQLPPSISIPRESLSIDTSTSGSPLASPSPSPGSSAMSSFFQFFKPSTSSKPAISHIPKIYKRSQTIKFGDDSSSTSISSQSERRKATTGDHEKDDPNRLSAAPPKTTIFESAGDLLKPPLPSVEFLINPSSRPRAIFHDRVYHPEDIPPPPLKKRATSSLLHRRRSASIAQEIAPSHGIDPTGSDLSTKDYDNTKNTSPDKDPYEVVDGSSMKVEEKIARAYHRDLSWRKVLVRLEPDAHNNMIVRRMFANAYGWPVVKHLVDTHFSDSAVARMRDEDETNQERAKEMSAAPDTTGDETKGDKTAYPDGKTGKTSKKRTASETIEDTDKLHALSSTFQSNIPSKSGKTRPEHSDSTTWSDRDWIDSEIDSDDPDSTNSPVAATTDSSKRRDSGEKAATGTTTGSFGWNWTEAIAGKRPTSPKGTDRKEIDAFLGKPLVTSPPPIETTGSASASVSAQTKVKDIETVAGEPVPGLGHDGLGTLLPDVGGVAETVAKLVLSGDNDGKHDKR